MKLDSSYIKDLEIIGSGTFGKVYKDGDKVYKLYKEEVKGEFYQMHSNPSLNNGPITRYKLNRLKRINGKMKNCNLAYDSIYIDGKFSGVVADYFEGENLLKVKDELTFDEKVKVSRKIIKAMKELQRNGIYPLDMHLNNIMVGEGLDVRLIDLDDHLTKVRLVGNPIIRRQSVRRLKYTIEDIFDIDSFYYYCNEHLRKYRYSSDEFHTKPTFNGIEEFLKYKGKKKQVLFISKYTDIKKINKFGKRKIVLVYDEKDIDGVEAMICTLYEQGITLDEILPSRLKKNYINDNNITDYYDISDDSTRYVLLKK